MVATIPNYDKWHEVERLRAERNAVANKMKGKLEPSVRQALVEEGKNLKEGLIALEEDLVQVSGSKFYYLKNKAVLLEMALVNWAITEVSKKGFIPLITPGIVRPSVVEKCGFQPRAQSTQYQQLQIHPSWNCHFCGGWSAGPHLHHKDFSLPPQLRFNVNDELCVSNSNTGGGGAEKNMLARRTIQYFVSPYLFSGVIFVIS